MGKTPVGVVLLGFVALVAGVAHLFAGLTLMGYVAFWDGELGSGMFLWGAITFALGVAFMACAIALVVDRDVGLAVHQLRRRHRPGGRGVRPARVARHRPGRRRRAPADRRPVVPPPARDQGGLPGRRDRPPDHRRGGHRAGTAPAVAMLDAG